MSQLPNNQIIFYQGENGAIELRGDFANDTIWTNQKENAQIFGVNILAINKHIKNILGDQELDASTVSKMEIVQKEGHREVEFYNY